MPRYIHADALLESLKNFTYAEPCTDFQRGVNAVVPLILSEIKHFHTADVVPRAEVERIFEEIENIVAADDIHEDLEYEELHGAYAAINRIKRKVLEYKMKCTEEVK